MHAVNRGMLWIWLGMCSDMVCYFLFYFCSVGGFCFVVTSDGCLWFGYLSGMEITDMGCVLYGWIMLWLDK
ncbi:E3 ubiquitin-protein ligase CCNB1IP1-like protein isoform X1 [Iris pallida]|uniref:E3 ubiquitin-protein ligase CCNB1IP1-like protein isoform X1 n=1 Tax=Iris pallida TaxID=29817 RepID=A0AAX6GXW6_IRIPA|nr:E3 ubiquitin-protein ligase CCNB1IP1-like protein isoform X1 [Iris pallida]